MLASFDIDGKGVRIFGKSTYVGVFHHREAGRLGRKGNEGQKHHLCMHPLVC